MSSNDPTLTTLEDRMTRRLADSVESLGEIIQEYAKKMKSLEARVKDLEKKPKSMPKVNVKRDPRATLKNSKIIKTASKKTLTARDSMQHTQSEQVLRNSFEEKLGTHHKPTTTAHFVN